jgi:ATP-dependent RNA helicase DOB1
MDEDAYVKSFRPEMLDVMYAWAKGAKFSEVCKMTELFEGNIIRAFRLLEELLRQLSSAAKAIGNTDLEMKFAESKSLLLFDANVFFFFSPSNHLLTCFLILQ